MSARTKFSIYFFGLLSTAIAFAVPFFYFDRSPGFDWTYFNPLSLVVRSSVLHYFTLPIHNPWTCGGIDILANPQSRIFSPLGLLDILFPPEWANVGSLICCSLLGYVGMYYLLQALGAKHRSALVAAFLFINGSFFGLHFAEGHITFGPLLLLPWSLYFFRRWSEAKAFFWFCLLHVFFIHSGAIYAFIFSILLCLFYTFFFPEVIFRKLQLSLRIFGVFALILSTTGFLALIKVIPILYEHGLRKPEIEFTFVSAQQVFGFLTDFYLTPQIAPPDLKYRAHEFACHLSLVALLLLFLAFLKKSFFKQNYRYFLLCIFWLVVAFGWGNTFNPWHLFQKLPLINNAHVQSRLVVLLFLFFVVLVAQALTLAENRKILWIPLSALLVMEAAFVRNYPVLSAYSNWSFVSPTTELITHETIKEVVGTGWEMDHYFSGNASKTCYEPALPRGLPYVGGSDWVRPVLLSQGIGSVELLEYAPRSISIKYSNSTPVEALINANFLSGWKIADGNAQLSPTSEGIIRLKIAEGEGIIRLRYSPAYLPSIFACFIIALVGLFCLSRFGIFKTHRFFEYNSIPPGYYDLAFLSGGRVQRHWHHVKFRRVLDLFPEAGNESILDIGCAAGTFLGLIPEHRFHLQVGVDLSETQIAYATNRYGTDFRRFIPLASPADLRTLSIKFDVITLIEVIEHLEPKEIETLLASLIDRLNVGGKLVITTPNYASVWPVLEFFVNVISEVGYWDQHVTKFNAFNLESKIRKLMGKNGDLFEVECKTTSHFITPFLAWFSPRKAEALSRSIEPQKWKNPFGCIQIIIFRKIDKDRKAFSEAI